MFEKRKKGSAHIKKDDKISQPPDADFIGDDGIEPENGEEYFPEQDYIYDDVNNQEYYYPEDSGYEAGYEQEEYADDEAYYPPEEDIPESEPVKKSSKKSKKEKTPKAPKEKSGKKEAKEKKEKSGGKAAKENKAKPEKTKAGKPEKQSGKNRKNKKQLPGEEDYIADEQPKKKGKHKKLKIILICILAVLLLAFAGITYWAYTITHNEVNLPKVYVDGVFVGGMSREQATEALDKVEWDKKAAQPFTVKLPADVSIELDRCKAGAMFTKEAAVDAAYSYGHSNNIYDNLYKYIMNIFKPVDMNDGYLKLDPEYINAKAGEVIAQFNEATADASQVVDEETDVLRFRKGAGEMKISKEKLAEKMSNALKDNSELLVYDTIESELVSPDFDAIFQELNAEPKDAKFVGDNFEVEDEVVGCTFDVQEAKDIWNNAKPADVIEIPLQIDRPEITGDYLRSLLYRDVLGSQITYFKNSSDNRKNNIRLAAEKINGVIVMPGQVFSYNETVGERTKEAGYAEASAYDNGEIVQEVGGGICQVSSTLYCAAMFAQLDTVERTNHYFKVSYLDWGMDATVSWGTLDYKFRNSREYPVKIQVYFNDEEESLQVDILGTDVDGSYVKFDRSRLLVFDDVYPDVVIGYTVIGYRNVYDAEGNFLRKVEEPIGIYYLHKDEIKYPENAGVEGEITPPA